MINKYKIKNNNNKLLDLLFKSKTFYGELKEKGHNKILRPFIYGIRHNNYIINLKYISIFFKRIFKLIKYINKKNKKILIIGNSNDISFLVGKDLLKKNNNIIFFNKEWKHGLLTNDCISTFKKVKNKIKLIIIIKSPLILITENYLNKELSSLNVPIISLVGTDQKITQIDYPIVTNLKNIKSIYTYLYLMRKTF